MLIKETGTKHTEVTGTNPGTTTTFVSVVTQLKHSSVRELGVTLDSELTFQRHVNKVASACFYYNNNSSFEADLLAACTLRPVLFLRSC